MTDKPILYSFRRCPYAMRARMALLISGTACFIREVKLSHKPKELIAASPKATVPVLVRPDGGVIEESLAIMRWSLAHNDPEGWLEREDRALIEANDGPFKHHLDRYKYPERHASDPVEHRAAGLALLEVLEARLAARRNLCGDARGITDIAIFPFVRQFAETDRTWFDAQPLPGLQAWLRDHLQSILFGEIMVRIEPWRPGDAPLLFPAH
ncbi:glutathione S-transferase [Sphingomonas sp. DBB INV C78]|uniref:glutathione S-transferase n=1 Tax=Sphingomonas sp. DBB INV C78 TaxID=3349434 RepID=UPI0036D2F819